MVDGGSILVTGAAGQLGAVGRTVTSLLLERGLPVRAMVHREDDRAAALRAASAEVVVGDLLNQPTSIGSSAAAGESISACPCPPGTLKLP
jgi:NAD(P)H dehydrogenase (quinone)